jgi:hypothetical protein
VTWASARGLAVRVCVIALFVVHINVTKAMIAALDLYSLPVYGAHRLRVDMTVTLGSAEYTVIRGLAVLGLLGFCVCLPLLAAGTIVSRKADILAQDRWTVNTFSFLFAGLRRDEPTPGLKERLGDPIIYELMTVTLMRKTLIVVAVSLLAELPYSQALAVVVLLVVSLMTHVRLLPYISDELNRLEALSAASLIVLVVLGMLQDETQTITKRESTTTIDVLLVLVVAVTAVAFVIALWSFGSARAKLLLEKLRAKAMLRARKRTSQVHAADARAATDALDAGAPHPPANELAALGDRDDDNDLVQANIALAAAVTGPAGVAVRAHAWTETPLLPQAGASSTGSIVVGGLSFRAGAPTAAASTPRPAPHVIVVAELVESSPHGHPHSARASRSGSATGADGRDDAPATAHGVDREQPPSVEQVDGEDASAPA